MGIERFQENFREWVERVFQNREYILGRSPESLEPSSGVQWPRRRREQKREMANRVYDIYSPPNDHAAYTRQLEEWTRFPALESGIERTYAKKGRYGYDSDFLEIGPKGSIKNPPLFFGRVYVRVDTRNRQHVRRLAGYLIRELRYGTRGICIFKIAGPAVPGDRRDSAVIYLNDRGIETRTELAATVASLIPLEPALPYGVENLASGVGYAAEPGYFCDAEWQWEYVGEAPSFGKLLSAYLARTLARNPENPDNFANALADLLRWDGIDPKRIHQLSDTTRFEIV